MSDPNTHPAPTVAVVVDADGNKHWAASGSKFVVDGLADGTLREPGSDKNQAGQENTDAPVPAPGEDLDPGTTDNGPDDGQPDPGPGDDGDGAGVAGAETSRRPRGRG